MTIVFAKLKEKLKILKYKEMKKVKKNH